MKFDTIINTIVWLALSFDTVAGRKSSKSHKPKKCSQVLYYDPAETFKNTQLYSAGPPALGNQDCGPSGIPNLQNCSGDTGKHIYFCTYSSTLRTVHTNMNE